VILLSGFLALFLLFREKIALLLGLPSSIILYLFPLVLFYVFSSWFEQIYIPQRESKKITIRNIVNSYSVFIVTVSIILLFLHDNRYMGPIYASLIIGVIFAVYYAFALRRYIKIAFSFDALKYMLTFSIPLLPFTLSSVILDQFDRVMINKYSGFADAGLYSFAYNVGMLVTLVLSALQQAWAPDYFKNMDEKNHAQLDSDIVRMLIIIAIAGLSLILFGRELGMVLAKNTYHAALVIVPVIVIGYLFYAVFTFYAWNIQYAKKNIYLSLAVLSAGLINIGLNVYFIPRYGYVAAAYTTAASYLFMALFGLTVNKVVLKLYAAPVRLIARPFVYLIPFIAAYYVLTAFDLRLWFSVPIKAALLLVFSYIVLRKYFPQMGAFIRT
jgi:O-antigen/teichoic acid export membrane protein